LWSIGGNMEEVIHVLTSLAILTFLTDRLDRPAERILIALITINMAIQGATSLMDPHAEPGFSISGCKTECPRNALAVTSTPPWWWHWPSTVTGYGLAVLPIATAALIVFRFVTGTPPRRRALAIGAPLALLFLAMHASYRTLFILYPNGLSLNVQPVHSALQWTFAGARALVWYGFLFALIGAELFAGLALNTLVRDSTGRPSLRDLERLLSGPLGDPGLQLGFWNPPIHAFVDANGEILVARSGQAFTTVDRDGRPAVAIAHDAQLAQDPELLQAAGAVALLAEENAELEAAWQDSLRELTASRMRLVTAEDRERRKLERDLHDGAQQQLMAIQHAIRVAQDQVDEQTFGPQLDSINEAADHALDELRSLAHGLYPPILRDLGLADALRAFARTVPMPIQITDNGISRSTRPVEAAIYFCSTEAIQNAVKYAGAHASITITLGRDEHGVRFSITDDGVGMDQATVKKGDGLIGMHDRIGAVGGTLDIISLPGAGTTVRGTVPFAAVSTTTDSGSR
jgi:signal transduction histidine kinase